FAVGLFDWMLDICAPIVVGAIATMALIIRVLLQKHRAGQQEIWRRNRKMVLQLASVSIIYIVAWTPGIVCFVVPLIVPNPFALELAVTILSYISYVPCLLCPFMCLIGLPEVRKSIKQVFIRTDAVQPLFQKRTALITTSPYRQ
ncbi:unnamed protein product, partial [Rotaria sp. Silwood2]